MLCKLQILLYFSEWLISLTRKRNSNIIQKLKVLWIPNMYGKLES